MLRKTASAASVPPAITPRSPHAQVEIHFVINLRNKHHKVPRAGVGTGAAIYSLTLHTFVEHLLCIWNCGQALEIQKQIQIALPSRALCSLKGQRAIPVAQR